ncbi:apolipoprotein N-acyltransferase [Sulfurisoma sediminicola]|uniref:Apolipoprotein N-acyltransferase n=1 Tax=Sulfurisoma sediminicola TaxID=1381557 RepID=A0A497XNB6_9PROT|nr:apolipoprotein N-acyltransferase [Sulfurisoma sediminicola]RLJ67888.1 apolipoprotein N-acyltransferase [Sulfurisoma sediminicola]
MKRQDTAALLLGAATVLGFAPFGLFPLPLLTLALLFRMWRKAPTPRTAAWLGFVWGLGFFLAGVSWVYVSLHDVGGMIAPLAAFATLLFCSYLALFPALAGYLFRRLADNTPRPLRDAFLIAGLWTLAEWLRGTLFTGFPWLALGYSQSPPSPLAGYAPLLGSYGLAFIVALLAALLGFGWRRFWPALLVVGVIAFGFVLRGIGWTEPVGAPLRVVLLQGNVPQSLKWDPKRLSLSIETYLRLARENPAQLTVLPETAIPLLFDEVPREVLRELAVGGETLLGVAVRTMQGGYANGAVALQPGGSSQGYAKSHLVPFGEFVPPGFAWFFDLVRIPMSNFTSGPPRQPPLALAGQKIMPNICYEDLFGEEVIRALPEATLLVNLSNTAWFGDSLAQPQHLQIAQLRALETGRPMLRATNTGMTAAIAPDGTVAAVLAPFTRDALRVEVRGYRGITPYGRRGNGPALLLALLACLATLRGRRKSL